MTTEELLKIYFTNQHIIQSPEWGQFKTLVGSRAVSAGKSQITIHKLPLGIWSVGYAPKVRPEDFDLNSLFEVGQENGCIFIKIDVPHANEGFKILDSRFKIERGKPIFAQSTILMDLTRSDDEILTGMHEKARYNLRLAQKKGVEVKAFSNLQETGAKKALNEFIRLQKETAARQKFFVHPDHYYKTCFEILSSHGMAFLLEASVSDRLPESTDKTPGVKSSATAASWILFRDGDVLYYPYGESNYEFRAYMPSNLLMWEAVQLGKKLGCKVFDLWGAADDPNDEKDPWHGFTRFKLSFGGLHVKLAPTSDLVINPILYLLFNFINSLRWRTLRFLRR